MAPATHAISERGGPVAADARLAVGLLGRLSAGIQAVSRAAQANSRRFLNSVSPLPVLHSYGMRTFALLSVLTAGCSGTTNPGASASHQQFTTEDGGTCHYPANVVVNSNPSGLGCFASPPKQICQVTNGATIDLADGGVAGGTENCTPLCNASQYEVTCKSAGPTGTIPNLDFSLGCQVIPIPTPSSVLFYCCPCAG